MNSDPRCRDLTGEPESGRNWARTSDLRLVEAALSQLSYTPQRDAGFYAGSLPLARIVSSNIWRVECLGCQPSALSFSFETTQGYAAKLT